LVFRFAERISVMVMGSILVQGPPLLVAADRRVREVYLGEADRGLSVGT
jgi:branched-chain amino acid transport system ATP-binding protein